MNRESCIQTIELLRQLALNIHGVIDVIDDRNCNDIINLLKEQEAQKFFVEESGKITPLPVVVRCKDCKHYDEAQRGAPRAEKRRYVCDDFNPPDDWFCADGERK